MNQHIFPVNSMNLVIISFMLIMQEDDAIRSSQASSIFHEVISTSDFGRRKSQPQNSTLYRYIYVYTHHCLAVAYLKPTALHGTASRSRLWCVYRDVVSALVPLQIASVTREACVHIRATNSSHCSIHCYRDRTQATEDYPTPSQSSKQRDSYRWMQLSVC